MGQTTANESTPSAAHSLLYSSNCGHPEIYENIPLISSHLKVFFTCLFTIYMLAGTVLNTLVIYFIIKLRQFENQSTLLIFILSCIESFASAYRNTLYLLFLWRYRALHCLSIFILKTFAHLVNYGSSFLICLISFDRMIRLFYLNNYRTTFTRNKFWCAVTTCGVLVVIQSSLNSFATMQLGQGYGSMVTLPINGAMFLSTLISHFLCIRKLQIYNRESKAISSEDKNLLQMAFVYFSVFCVCNLPAVLYTITLKNLQMKYLTKEVIGILTCLVFFCINTSTIVNSVTFMLKNRLVKQELRKTFNKFRLDSPTIRVASVQPESA